LKRKRAQPNDELFVTTQCFICEELTMKILGLSVMIFASSYVYAQEGGQFNGEWMARYDNTSDEGQQVKLTIADQGGSWHAYRGGKRNPCVRRDIPIAVERKSPSEILVQVKAAEFLQGCPNSTLSLKLTAPDKLEGSFVTSAIPVMFEKHQDK